jgi:hypothetical protein
VVSGIWELQYLKEVDSGEEEEDERADPGAIDSVVSGIWELQYLKEVDSGKEEEGEREWIL